MTAGHNDNTGLIYNGAGVLKSTDGGATWAQLGLSTFGYLSLGIGAMAASGQTVWAATTGATWAAVTVPTVPSGARFTDVQLDPSTPTTVYAVASDFRYSFYAGIYKSVGGGQFALISGAAPMPEAYYWGRTQLTISPSAPSTLYTVITSITTAGVLLGIFKSTDGGATWTTTTRPSPDPFNDQNGGQGYYDIFIAVHPTDPNTVFVGGIDIVKTTDAGTTWTAVTDVYCSGAPTCSGPIHPDQHAGKFRATGDLYVANDGGIYKSANGGTNWNSLNTNLATMTFYAGGAAGNYLTTPVVVGGAQDNGTSRSGSASLGRWNGILGGDGGYAAIDPMNPDHIYAEYPGGAIYVTTNASAGQAISWRSIYPPSNGCAQRGTFINAFVMDPHDANHLLWGGGGGSCESVNGGTSWLAASYGSFNVHALAIAPASSATMYAGETGAVYRSTNGHQAGAATWSACGSGLPNAPILGVAVDANDATIAYATFGNFGLHHVWKSVNCAAWQDISGTGTGALPDVPATSIVTYPTGGSPALIVGTDIGVFLSTNNGASWSALQSGLPNAGITQLFTDGAQTTLFAATYGRGMWSVPIPSTPNPTVSAITPSFGSTAGGTTVTLTGTLFQAGVAVDFGGHAATNIVVTGTTTITLKTPAHAAGVVDVTVTNPDGGAVVVSGGFTFGAIAPLPGPQPTGSVGGAPSPLPGARPAGSGGGVPNPLPSARP
ncbi:MAG: IPT/TIG domain-containing protein [Thermomicrobiales bacterium]